MTVHGLNTLDPINEFPAYARYVRLWDCGVTWRDLNPAKGVFMFDRLDKILAAHPTVRFTLVLGHGPAWAARNPFSNAAPWIGPGSNSAPYDMADWRAYVAAVATRYRDKINAYQIWNEPQLRDFWEPWDQIGALGLMTAQAKTILDDIDPGALVVSAPCLPRESSGGMKRASKYLHALRAQRWPVDVHAAHIYPEPGKGPAVWQEHVQRWKQGLVDAGAPRKLLWVTETNYNLMAGPLPPEVQESRVTMTEMRAQDERLARVFWYAWGRHLDPKVLGIPMLPGTRGAKALTKLL